MCEPIDVVPTLDNCASDVSRVKATETTKSPDLVCKHSDWKFLSELSPPHGYARRLGQGQEEISNSDMG